MVSMMTLPCSLFFYTTFGVNDFQTGFVKSFAFHSITIMLQLYICNEKRKGNTRHGDRGAGPVGAQFVVRCTSVTSGMSFVHLAEVQRTVSPVEDALNVVRIEKKSILLPTQVR